MSLLISKTPLLTVSCSVEIELRFQSLFDSIKFPELLAGCLDLG